MKKIILFALAAIMMTGCVKQPTVMENQAIKNIMTRVSVTSGHQRQIQTGEHPL